MKIPKKENTEILKSTNKFNKFSNPMLSLFSYIGFSKGD